MEQFLKDFLMHEDVWIFIILAILTLNSIIIVWSMHKESKKTDVMYEFIKNLLKK